MVINHVQDSYLDPNNPVDAALRQKINDFVEEIRPFVKGIAWSFAEGTNARNVEYDAAGERARSPAFRPGDIELVNNEGKGQDSGFLKKLEAAGPGAVILAGVYYEACSMGTASTIREALRIPVAVPKDLADAAAPDCAYHHESAASAMAQIGIDVKSMAAQLLEEAKQLPYVGPAIAIAAAVATELKLPPQEAGREIAGAAAKQNFTIRPIRDGDESQVCKLLGGDNSKLDFEDPKHPVNITVALIESSRNPDAKGGGWIAIADGKPVGVATTENFGGALSVTAKYASAGIAEALSSTRDDFQSKKGPEPVKAAPSAQKNAPSL